MALDQPQPAAASYEQACQCDPGNADAWVGRSRALFRLGEDKQALDCLEKGVALDDKPPFLMELMRYRQKQARWDDLPALWARVLAQLDEHNAYSMAFPMLAHPGATGADLLRSARACMAAERAKLPRPLPAPCGWATSRATCAITPFPTCWRACSRRTIAAPSV